MRILTLQMPRLVVIGALIAALNVTAHAANAPTLFNFQGRLTNSSGIPVTSPQLVRMKPRSSADEESDPLLASARVGFPPGAGVSASPVNSDSEIMMYRRILDEAKQHFTSLDYPEAIYAFTKVVDSWEAGKIPVVTPDAHALVAKAYEGRGLSFGNMSRISDAAADFKALQQFDPAYAVDFTGVSPRIVALYLAVQKGNDPAVHMSVTGNSTPEAVPGMNDAQAVGRGAELVPIPVTAIAASNERSAVKLGDLQTSLDACTKDRRDCLVEALHTAEAAVKNAPSNTEARWALAQIYEYLGNLAEAIPLYEGIVRDSESTGHSDELSKDASAHLITCRFLVSMHNLAGQEASPAERARETRPGEVGTGAPVDANLPVSPTLSSQFGYAPQSEGIAPQLGEVRDLASATIAESEKAGWASVKPMLDRAIQLVNEWIQHPPATKIEKRNRLMAGVVSIITSVVADAKLGGEVSKRIAGSGKTGSLSWPTPGFAPEMEKEFQEHQPAPSQSRIEVATGDGGSVRINEQWQGTPRVAGTWQCENPYGAPSMMTWRQEGNRISTDLSVQNFSSRCQGTIDSSRNGSFVCTNTNVGPHGLTQTSNERMQIQVSEDGRTMVVIATIPARPSQTIYGATIPGTPGGERRTQCSRVGG